MAAELHKHTQLSNMFDCPEAVVKATEGVAAIKNDLILVKDVWDASSLVEQQFQVCQPSALAYCECDLLHSAYFKLSIQTVQTCHSVRCYCFLAGKTELLKVSKLSSWNKTRPEPYQVWCPTHLGCAIAVLT